MSRPARSIFVFGIYLIAILLVVLRLAPPILIGFALVDVAGAMWTRAGLRSQGA